MGIFKRMLDYFDRKSCYAPSTREFIGKIGIVASRISYDTLGEVILDSRIGRVNYLAKLSTPEFYMQNKPIEANEGDKVVVVDAYDSGVLIVEKLP